MDIDSHDTWLKILNLINDGAKFKPFKKNVVVFKLDGETRCLFIDLISLDSHPSEIIHCAAFLNLGARYPTFLKVFVKTKTDLFTLNRKCNQWVKMKSQKKIWSLSKESGVRLSDISYGSDEMISITPR